MRFALVGTGRVLLACADQLVARGHEIVGLLSDCPQVAAWAHDHGITRTARAESDPRWRNGIDCDYLLSIVNHEILSALLLASAAKGAINYHDALLPSYAGFNATSWAILEGQATHGVSWHTMTGDVDGGDILLQRTIEVSDDDTAFTLGVKCSDAGVESFATLLAQMEQDSLSPRAQHGQRSFHPRSDRPGPAVLDFARPAGELHALVRALTFGPEDNWMATPKLRADGGYLSVLDARLVAEHSGVPGTVLAIDADGIRIAAQRGSLFLTALATPDGVSLDPIQAAARVGMHRGARLPGADESFRALGDAFDASVTRAERFWVERLATRRAATVPGMAPAVADRVVTVLRRALPEALENATLQRRLSVLVAALAACLRRLGNDDCFDIGMHTAVPEALRGLYETVVPLRCTVDASASFRMLIEQADRELVVLAKRRTFARDVTLRYRALQVRDGATPSLPICVQTSTSSKGAHGESGSGAVLTLVVSDDAEYAWAYDRNALSASSALEFADRFDALLIAALEDMDTPLHALPIVTARERQLLLVDWQQTARSHDAALCVHQQFERQVRRTPNAMAAVFGDAEISYRTLNERANGLAIQLRGAGVGPDVLVGLSVTRSLDMLVGLLGILKAGGAYVPLDPSYPQERLAMMLEDSRATLVVTQSNLVDQLSDTNARLVLIDRAPASESMVMENPDSGVRPHNLAYVIFTSGSTGRPKGTMIEHRNVANFFAGMDDVVGPTPGVWLAVTSISFDISVLELFWTLSRGFEVVIAPEQDRASLERRERNTARPVGSMGFGLFYFAADSGAASAPGGAYRLLLEGAKFADTHGFAAVWTPERHFHAFGGLYPNPAVTTAALSTITTRVHLRAGSVVLPLHNPLRVAEDWAVIDQLSGGRVGLSFASGWHANDFAFMPENFERRREVMLEHIETVLTLWRGGKTRVRNGTGEEIEVGVLPRPVQERPPIWIASAGSVDTFTLAGRLGANVLTNMLGQDLADLEVKFAAYRTARREHGHEGDGIISVMLHTFVTNDTEQARELARRPFSEYLASSYDLVKVAPRMFPAFRQPSRDPAVAPEIDQSAFSPEDMGALLDHAFDRYFDTAGLFGTPERAMPMLERLSDIGANEVACLIDFGIDADRVLDSLPHLHRLQELWRARVASSSSADHRPSFTIADAIRRRGVTHLQCTPSMAGTLVNDGESLAALARLERMLVGGEALSPVLADRLASVVKGDVLNMYGPTETTVWSTTTRVVAGAAPTIGRPIANTVIRLLDEHQQLVPIGTTGELCIGGAGVVRGYLDRPELTSERFIPDPWAAGGRLYRTGDLARYRDDGTLEFLGRLDDQVKVNGFRIELGEIETVLTRHPAVRQSVVVARRGDESAAGPTLVAYVVLERGTSSADADARRVGDWRTVWDDAYQRTTAAHDDVDPRFRIAGWNDSHTGEPIPADEMREWLDGTVGRIRALVPRRVLELGCGTGMILYRLLADVEHYTGVDISDAALGSIRRELTSDESSRVILLEQAADAISGVKDHSFDLVVINSVAQYFPNAEYLIRVLRRASELVEDGGHIFVGDVRSLDHLELFHTAIELQQSPAPLGAVALRARVERRSAHESELVLSERFFEALTDRIPRLAYVTVQLKRGRARNELTAFRYDVVLHVGHADIPTDPVETKETPADSLEEIRALIADRPPVLHLTNVPNARLSGMASVLRAMQSDSSFTVERLRARLDEPLAGVDPEALFTLDDAYEANVRWARSGDPSRFDAILRRGEHGSATVWSEMALRHGGSPADFANTPVRMNNEETLSSELRTHLQSSLPEYMVPSTYVVLDALPLTPNGKVNRKALPDPVRRVVPAVNSFAPPSNDLERQIAEVWQQLLAVDRVGRRDNIFDLGANSLLTMQANSRLSSLLGRKVSLVDMFRFPTVESLAAHLGENGDGHASPSNDKRVRERASRAEQAAERRRALRAERGEK